MNEEIELILDVAEEQMKEAISRLEVVLSKKKGFSFLRESLAAGTHRPPPPF